MMKRKYKVKKESIEELLIDLYDLIKKGSNDRETAQSLLTWYAERKYLTSKQMSYARILINKNKATKRNKPKKYHLYAIGDGDSVKLGVSTNVNGRLKTIQTGHPKTLKVLWRFYTGRERKMAYKAEKKLHRYCKKYRERGEWFNSDCMTLVNQFSLKEKITMDNEQEEHDLSLLGSSPL